MADIFDMVDTWNNGATTFTAIKMNVTDTASAAGSLLMDLQVGGASKLQVTKAGDLFLTATSASIGGILIDGTSLTNAQAYVGKYGMRLANGLAFSWASGSNLNTLDLILARDAANTLAQRNGVNAQAFRIYNTYTNASNYERGVVGWASNVFCIGTEKAGTGASRNGALISDGTTRLTWGAFSGGFIATYSHFTGASAGSYDLGIGPIGGAFRRLALTEYVETAEMTAPAAPSANSVRIYAEDNGSGKTRLMALFATGAAQQIAIEP